MVIFRCFYSSTSRLSNFCHCFSPSSRSAKYQACIIEASSASSTAPEQNSNPLADLNDPDPVRCTQQDGSTNEHDARAATEATEDQSGVANVDLQKPEIMAEEHTLPSVDVSESADSPKEDPEVPQVEQTKSGTGQSEQDGAAPAEQGAVVPKPKKDKLTRLRELGLEPPPVAKLCADDGAFVQLEPQLVNPGEEAHLKKLQIVLITQPVLGSLISPF